MTNSAHTDRTLAAAGLEPAELEDILRRLDENLSLRSALRDPGPATAPGGADERPVPADMDAIGRRIQALRELRAPLFVLGGPVLSRVAALCNAPMRLLLRKQVQFNEELLGVLDALRDQVAALRRSAVPPDDRDRSAEAVRPCAERIDAVAAEMKSQGDWLKLLAEEVRGQGDWMRLLQGRVTGLALDLREAGVSAPAGAAAALPEPRVVDPESYARKVAAMPGGLRVNVGCGEKPLDGFINVDRREQPGVDVVADVRRLPFEPGTVAELASSHLVEHFREHELRVRVLPVWRALLRDGGLVRIVCPDWAAMLARQGDGRLPLAQFTRITFGGQDYEGNDHFAMYTPETLSELLLACGFSRVDVVARDRMASGCPEMEVVGYR